MGGNCCIIIDCMGGHAGVIDGMAGLYFQIICHGCFQLHSLI